MLISLYTKNVKIQTNLMKDFYQKNLQSIVYYDNICVNVNIWISFEDLYDPLLILFP